MKYFLNTIAILLLFVVFSCKKNQKESTSIDDNVSKSKQWKSLFNGENLDDWIPKIGGHKLNENYNNTFKVENGVIKVSYENYDKFIDNFGHLFYKTPFSNYRLRLEYRFVGQQVPGSPSWGEKNSGIMIHSQSPESMLLNQNFPLSLEFQLLGGITKDELRSTGNLCTPATNVHFNGELITEHCISSDSKTYYQEEWITAEVIVNNGDIAHYIDGEAVITYSNPTVGGEFLDQTSKEIQNKEGAPLTSGFISLQSEGHPVEFRAIEILEY